MRAFTLNELARLTGGLLTGSPEVIVDNIIIDSRKAFRGSSTLFIAITGKRNNGHNYIPDLYGRGIRNFMVEEGYSRSGMEDASFIAVENSMQALRQIAAYIRFEFKAEVLGITGSNGKTIVKEWIYQALRDKLQISRSPESYNSQVGVPLSLFLLETGHDLAIIEAGISEPGEMEKLEEIIKPTIGIITNIGAAHQENFSSLKEKTAEKLKLFKNSGLLIYSSDYHVIKEVLHESYPNLETISWGRGGQPDYRIITTRFENGNRIRISGKCEFSFQINFSDDASLENAMHVFVYLHSSGYPLSFIEEALKKLEPVAMRMEMLKGLNNCTIINDSYNSDLVSVANAIHFLNQQKQHKLKTLILSDILQSGQADEDLYKEVAGMAFRNKIYKIIGIGEGISSQSALFGPDAYFYKDTSAFLRDFDLSSFKDEAILIKGSRKYRFELISAALQEKTHRTIMEIDLNAIVDNYRFYRSLLASRTKLMAMVKAFSYGSGIYEIANILQYHKVDYLAVAFTDEGVSLRKNGIETPIMVMNPEINDFSVLTTYHLEPEIYNFRILSAFKHHIHEKGISEYPVHVKIDTGMHRLGFKINEIDLLNEELNNSPFKIMSVFSHLAAADDPAFDDFTRQQIADFDLITGKMKSFLKRDFMRHILNSAGIERFPESHYDMVRLGIGLYGVSSFMQNKLNEVSSFKTKITQIMELREGDTVGYGRKGKVKGKMRIATLAVGYADGLPRLLGNGKINFFLKGKRVPTFGNICMDMCMIDVSEVDAEEGDEVEIFGKNISVNELAESAGTIPYEILTNISSRVKRIYYRE